MPSVGFGLFSTLSGGSCIAVAKPAMFQFRNREVFMRMPVLGQGLFKDSRAEYYDVVL